jgi:glycosyl transferase family 25
MNSLLDFPVYYINLKKNTFRNEYMINHLTDLGIKKYYRVDAVDGSSVSPTHLMSNNETGCTMSHIKAIEYFLQSEEYFAIICEDDADLSNIANISIDDIKINKLFCLQTSVICREEDQIIFSQHKRNFFEFGTSSYIINKKYAQGILDRYGSYTNVKWNNFISKIVIDPRGGNIFTRPVADELIYSLCDVDVFPIFTFKNFKSTINQGDEQYRQIKTSIEKFSVYWENRKDKINEQ